MRVSRGFLFFRPLFAKLAFQWLVDGPRHVVHTPIEGKFAVLLGLWVAILGRDLLPGLILLLLFLVGRVLLVFSLAFLLLTSVLLVVASPSQF
jgi:hypothetical protein